MIIFDSTFQFEFEGAEEVTFGRNANESGKADAVSFPSILAVLTTPSETCSKVTWGVAITEPAI